MNIKMKKQANKRWLLSKKLLSRKADIGWDKLLTITLIIIGFVLIFMFFTTFQSKSLDALDLSACKFTLTMSQFTRQQIDLGPAHFRVSLPNICRETLPIELNLPTKQAHSINDFEHEMAVLIKKSWDMIGGGSAGTDVWENAFYFSLIHSPKDKCFPVFLIKLKKTHFFKETKSFTPMDLLLYLASTPSGKNYKCVNEKCYEYSYLQYITYGNGFLFIDLDPENSLNGKQEFKPGETYTIAIFSPSEFKTENVDLSKSNITLTDVNEEELRKRGGYETITNAFKEINFVGCPSCYSAAYLDDKDKVEDEIKTSTNGIIITEFRRLRSFCNIPTTQ